MNCAATRTGSGRQCLATVTLADLEKHMTQEEMREFTCVDQKPQKPVVVIRGEQV